MAANAERTQLELTKPEYNYFILLNIPPYENDSKVIEAAFQKKSNKWANSKSALERRYAELQVNIKSVMVNDAGARTEEAKRACEFLLTKALDIVKTYAITGKIYDSKLKELAHEYCFTPDEKDTYDKILERLSVILKPKGTVELITGDGNTAKSADPRLQKYNVFVDIEKNLGTYSGANGAMVGNLYQLFSVEPDADVKTVESAAEALKKRYKGKADAVATAVGKLTSSAVLKYVTDPTLRKQYDIFLHASKCMDSQGGNASQKTAVWRELSNLKEQKIREADPEIFKNHLQRLVSDCHLSQEDARQELTLMYSYFGIEVPEASQNLKLVVCPFCVAVFEGDTSAASCPVCGARLVYSCWNCQTSNSILKDQLCRSCGASRLMLTSFQSDVAAVKIMLGKTPPDIAAIKIKLTEIRGYASKTDASTEIGKALAPVEKGVSDLEKDEESKRRRYASAERVKQEIIELKNSGKLDSAMTQIRDFKVKYAGYPISDVENSIKTIEARVEQLVNRANGLSGDAKINHALEALKLNCESKGAISILHSFRPDPVTSVTVTHDEKGNMVRWKASGTSSARYAVVRKVGGSPVSMTDGDQIASDLQITYFCDNSIAAATPYVYAVFSITSYQIGSKWETVTSVAACSSEIVYYPPLKNVIGSVTKEGLQVRWDRQIGISEVVVWRNDSPEPPKRIGEGKQVKSSDIGFLDRSLSKSGLYGYYLVCRYELNGKSYYSEPVKKTFDFYMLPDAPQDVEWKLAKKKGEHTTVSYKPVKTGRFSVYQSETLRSDIESGTYYKAEELQRLGLSPVECEDISPSQVRLSFPTTALSCYVYPASTITEGAVLGIPARYVVISDFKDVQIKQDHDAVVSLSMRWDNGADFCVVSIGNTACPKSPTDAVDNIRITKEQFNKEGRASFSLRKQSNNFLTVFAEFNIDGKTEYSTGVPIASAFDFREKIQVNYTVDFIPSAVKRFKVTFEFQSETDCGVLPEMDVVRTEWLDSKRYDGDSEELGVIQAELKKKLFSNVYTARCVFESEPAKSARAFYKLYFKDPAVRFNLVQKFKS